MASRTEKKVVSHACASLGRGFRKIDQLVKAIAAQRDLQAEVDNEISPGSPQILNDLADIRTDFEKVDQLLDLIEES